MMLTFESKFWNCEIYGKLKRVEKCNSLLNRTERCGLKDVKINDHQRVCDSNIFV